jgi:predicted branched-subunit amino acid permease
VSSAVPTRVLDHPETLSTSVIEQALRDLLPIVLAVAPFGLVVGMTIGEVGIAPGIGHLGSLLIFSGSAQLALLLIIDSGAGMATVLLTALVVSSRFVVYGAALAPSFRRQSRWFRWLGPHFLLDQTFGMATARTDLDDPDRFRAYWLTAGVGIGAAWIAATVGGSMLGSALPAGSPLEVAAPALFVGMLVPRLSDRRMVAAALVASGAAVALAGLPKGMGLPVAIVCGMFVGAVVPVGAGDRS